MSRFRRILYATDFSPASGAAFRRAVELARADRAALTIAHVYSAVIPVMGEGFAPPQLYDTIVADVRARAERELGRLVRGARKTGIRVKGLLLEGVPHDRIVRAARSTRADLVVLGTHGRTGLGRFFLGSVASRVVTLAPCPVLTVRGRGRGGARRAR
jgi:nucleotide-binding universal stress UspA family protein